MSAQPEPIEETDDLEVPDFPGDEAELIELMDWHANRMRWYRGKIAELETQRDRMVRRYQEWFERVTGPWQRKVAESEAWIVYAHLDALDNNPGHQKVLRLPSGVVRAVPPRPSVVVENPEDFKDWVLTHPDAERLCRVKVEPVKDEVRKVLLDGEVVPGVALSPGERSVRVSLGDDE